MNSSSSLVINVKHNRKELNMDIKDHINLIKNHGYKGKIGIVKHPINGIVMLAISLALIFPNVR